jgi:tetratricopeptide (TPR) repeat protein
VDYSSAALYDPKLSADETEAYILSYLSEDPWHPQALCHLGILYTWNERHDEAREAFKKASTGETISHGQLMSCVALGHYYSVMGDASLAKEYNDKAYAHARNLPGIIDIEGFRNLAQGDWKAGWTGWRRTARSWNRPYSYRDEALEWQGNAVPGQRLVVYTEHGNGDAIQALKCLRKIKRLSKAHIILETEPQFTRICAVNQETLEYDETRERKWPTRSMAEVMGYGPPEPVDVPEVDYDFHIGVFDALALMKVTPEGEALDRRAYLPLDVPHKGGIGIAWHGNRNQMTDCQRSISESFLGLFDFEWISLQQEDLEVKDWYDTAMVMAGLDLVISVDCSQAHMAGAMGQHVLTTLCAVPEWRWTNIGIGGLEDYFWYPNMKVMRQKRLGDWPELIERVNRYVQGCLTHRQTALI